MGENKSKEFLELPETSEQIDLIKDEFANHSKDAYPIILVGRYLQENYDFRNNTIAMEVEYKKKRESEYKFFDDRAYRDLDQEIRLKVAKIDERYLKNWIFGSKLSKDYDPIKQYLFSLPKWDGKTDHFETLLSSIKLCHESDRENFVWAFKKWFVAMVASLISEGVVNHTCFVLVSAQGRYKTTFLNGLVPPQFRLDYLYSSTFIAHNKDHEKYLFTKWLINLDEMQAFNRSDIESIKSKISQDRVAIRLPYAKADTKAWRKASFCGSVNRDKFLNDATGSRRFLPFKIDDIQINKAFDIGLVYAQALELFRSGFKFYFDREDIERLEEHNDYFKDKQFEEELLINHFVPVTQEQIDRKEAWIEYKTTTDIMDWLFDRYKNFNKNNTVRRNIGQALQANGFQRISKRINNKSVKVYAVKIVTNTEMTNADGSIMTEKINDPFT